MLCLQARGMLVYGPHQRENLAALKKNNSFRQFMTSIVNELEYDDREKEDDLADRPEDMAAHVMNFTFDYE